MTCKYLVEGLWGSKDLGVVVRDLAREARGVVAAAFTIEVLQSKGGISESIDTVCRDHFGKKPEIGDGRKQGANENGRVDLHATDATRSLC